MAQDDRMQKGFQGFQVAWFPVDPTKAADTENLKSIYSTIANADALVIQQFPGQSSSVVAGNDDNFGYRVQFSPGRIDLFITAYPPKFGPGTIPLIPLETDVWKRLQDVVDKSSALIGPLNRLALVVGHFKQTANSIEAVKLILSSIGLSLPSDDYSDFVFNINRRSQSKVSNALMINQLLRWSAEETTSFFVGQAPLPVNITLYGRSLQVDVNTVAGQGISLAVDEQLSVFREMSTRTAKLIEADNLAALEK